MSFAEVIALGCSLNKSCLNTELQLIHLLQELELVK